MSKIKIFILKVEIEEKIRLIIAEKPVDSGSGGDKLLV
jgi:hypothetical protein